MEFLELGKDIEECRQLCEELMAYQKAKATYLPEVFDLMNFDTRMKKSHQMALESQTVVVWDKGEPVGYVFSTVDIIERRETALPDWAPKGGQGFYPEWVDFPQKIGCLSNLYLRKEYRGQGLGGKLADIAIDWLKTRQDVKLIFTFISNGNNAALDFYVSKGFTYSHEVFGGFIKSCYTK